MIFVKSTAPKRALRVPGGSLQCPRQCGSLVERRLPSSHRWLPRRFQLHRNCNHLLHFGLDVVFGFLQVHKANPIRKYRSVEVKPSDQPLTMPKSPNFSDRFRC